MTPISIKVNLIKSFTSTTFVVRREGMPVTLLFDFVVPPFDEAEHIVHSKGTLIGVDVLRYDTARKAFKVLRTD